MNDAVDELMRETEIDAEQVNKADAIRRTMQRLGFDIRTPDIIDHLKGEGIEVSPAYVSLVRGQYRRTNMSSPTFEVMRLAKRLVKATGSVFAAKAALEAVAVEQELLNETRERYRTKIKEIDARLASDERLDRAESRDLLAEKRKIVKLIESLEEI